MGDQAVVSERACGCPYQQLGWTTHLHGIRSFEKLTAAGMTFLDTDVIRVLEEVLPGRFGGIPSDYQLVEEERRTAPRASGSSSTPAWDRSRWTSWRRPSSTRSDADRVPSGS